jgi:protein SCO1/2
MKMECADNYEYAAQARRMLRQAALLRIRSVMRGVLAVMVALLGVGFAVPAAAEPAGPQRVSRLSGGWPVEDFALTDQHGRPFTQDQFIGQWTFVLLGDTRCGEPCASALAALTGMRQRIAGTSRVKTTQVLFVSLAQDSPEQLRRYLAPYDEHFIGASGPPQTLAKLADELGSADAGLASSPLEADRNYSGTLSLVDPDGIVWGQFLPPFEVKMLTARYLKTRIGH